jgi:hypothetical protein
MCYEVGIFMEARLTVGHGRTVRPTAKFFFVFEGVADGLTWPCVIDFGIEVFGVPRCFSWCSDAQFTIRMSS